MNLDECKYEEGRHIDPPEDPHGGDCDCDYLEEEIALKQDRLTAGENITIENNVISATGGGATYTAGDHISIENNEISATYENATQSADGLMSKEDKTKLDELQKLTAGDYITISQDGTISGNYTKEDILEILGYEEIEISMTDTNDQSVSVTVLGVRNNG